MTIKGKNKTVDISGWLILAGLLVADSITCNVCRLKQTKILQNCTKNGKSN